MACKAGERAFTFTFVMVQLCHSNDFGSLYLCSPVAIRVLALLFAFQLMNACFRDKCMACKAGEHAPANDDEHHAQKHRCE
jgi:hypothetical protein